MCIRDSIGSGQRICNNINTCTSVKSYLDGSVIDSCLGNLHQILLTALFPGRDCVKRYNALIAVKRNPIWRIFGQAFVCLLYTSHGTDVEILILDALTYAGNLLTIKEEIELPNVTFVRGDIGDAPLVTRLIKEFDPDYIVNFAAESHVDRSISNPRLFLETNILGTQTLLNAAREAWLLPGTPGQPPAYREGKKIHQISTDEVYGSLSRTPGDPRPLSLTNAVARVVKGRDNLQSFGDTFFTESTPLAPRSPYSVSKTAADMLVMAYHETYGLPVTITRCSNNYGPYHFPEKLIPLVIKNILEGKKLPVYGRGENVRDWLYVADHCKGIDMVLRNGRVGQVYNIGGFNEEQNLSLIHI